MASVWFRGSDDEKRRQGWYRHMGLGRNIRTADVPLALTRKMAHEFTMAPDHYSVDMALRWGQVRGLGGEKALARAIVATRLGRSFEHEDFWRTVVHFFVNHPELGLEHVGPIVDYLHNQRFVAQEVFVEEGDISPDPPQPNLSMKGRTPRSLLRQVGEWHAWLRQHQRGARAPLGSVGHRRIPMGRARGGPAGFPMLDDPRAAHQRRALSRRRRDAPLRGDLRAGLRRVANARSGRCGSRSPGVATAP